MHSRPEGSKVSRFETCQQVQKSGIEPIEFVQAPELPAECAELWEAFTRLSLCSYQEIDAYQRLTGVELVTWEIDALIGLDKIRNNPPKVYEWSQKQLT